MKYISEFKSYYKEGDVVLIEYWYNQMIIPVTIIEQVSPRKYLVSFINSELKNAPDQIIKTSDIIDNHKG
jgi:hypothetical protein